MSNKISWFSLMWRNWYIQSFAGAIVMIIWVLKDYSKYSIDTPALCVALAIPILMIVIISYYGFYKYWKEIKNK